MREWKTKESIKVWSVQDSFDREVLVSSKGKESREIISQQTGTPQIFPKHYSRAISQNTMCNSSEVSAEPKNIFPPEGTHFPNSMGDFIQVIR
jgi:hypothetical protein